VFCCLDFGRFLGVYRYHAFERTIDTGYANLTFGRLDYSSVVPQSACSDSNPRMYLQAWWHFTEPGCLSRLIASGGTMGLFLALLQVWPHFEVAPKTAGGGIFINLLCYTVLSMMGGWAKGNFVASLGFLAV